MTARLTQIALCLSLAGMATTAQAELFGLIDARLEWMRDVAAYKFANDLPVEDLAREQIVIAGTLETATKAGLDPKATQAFFESQISAAKDIQTCWIARWTSDHAPTTYRDLTQEVRPAILDLGAQIIAALQDQTPVHASDRDDFNAVVQVDCLSEDIKKALFDALTQVRTFQ